ncbi:MAG: indolepyruvate oxidoreductase subunit beta [Actinobacteria bacterium]|nr:indolepyruvate oxidoreductase subunit beta [Actinomycetota bacterium]
MVKNDNNNNNYKKNVTIIAQKGADYARKWEISLKNGEILSVLFTGVGGQGIILATTVLAHAAINAGFDVKVSEVHGMAQRGGSVEGSVRIGKKVYSPTINKADFIVALEQLEALRYIQKLAFEGFILVNEYKIYPASASVKESNYPSDVAEMICSFTKNYYFIKTVETAKKLGNLKVSNMIMTGALSEFLPFSSRCWIEALKDNVPEKAVNVNIDAFNTGRGFAKN